MNYKLLVNLLLLMSICFYGNTSTIDSKGIEVQSVVQKIESLSDSPIDRARFIAQIDPVFLDNNYQVLYTYLKYEYDNLSLLDSAPSSLIFDISNLMFSIFYSLGEYDKAAKTAYELLDLSKEMNDSISYYLAYSSIAIVEEDMGNIESSLYFYKLAIEFAKVDIEHFSNANLELGNVYLYQGNHDLARKYIFKGVDLSIKLDDYKELANAYYFVMDFYYEIEVFDSAMIYYEKIDSIVQNNPFTKGNRTMLNANIRAAEIYRLMEEFTLSESYFELAYNIASEAGDLPTLEYICSEWAYLERVRGNYLKSLNLLDEHIWLKDTIFRRSSILQINTLKTKYELDKKDLEIKSNREKVKYARTNVWLISIIAIIFVVSLVILVFYLRIKLKASKLSENLIKVNAELSQKEVENLEKEVDLKNKKLADLFLHQYEKASMLNDVVENADSSSEQLKKALLDYKNKQHDWDNFKAHFDQVHEGFFDKLNGLSTALTPKDLRFCAYIRMNLSSKEIAIMLGISHRTVQGIRGRVRKKLNLDSKEDLILFLMNL